MSIVRLEPAYQHYVWGGSRIPDYFGRVLPEGRYAESWEVSDRDEGMSCVEGEPLRQFLQRQGRGTFPILVKIIDAAEHLSVQVHPDGAAALELRAEPKSEAWIALEESIVYAGFKEGVTPKDFLHALHAGSVESLLQKIVLEKGEALSIPAGCVHAICKGSLLLEIQQNSNTTYRIYDWHRQGRQLHIQEALLSIHWDQVVAKQVAHVLKESGDFRHLQLLQMSCFSVERLEIVTSFSFPSSADDCVIFCVEGECVIGQQKIVRGTTYLVLSNGPPLVIVGTCTLVVTRV